MLNVLYGRASQDLCGVMLGKIKESLDAIESGSSAAKRVVLVVPAQFTLETEQKAFEVLGSEGFFKLQIVSGNKLRQDVLREVGGSHKIAVNELGRSMLLRKIVRDKKASMEVFSSVADSPEFISMAGDFIVQLKQNNIDTGAYDALTKAAPEGSLLARKLSDMKGIYFDYQELMKGSYTDSEDLLQTVTAKLKDSRYIAESEIWYYGFYSFTRRETAFLSELSARCVNLSVMLCMGRKNDPDAELFDVTRSMCSQLAEACPGCSFCCVEDSPLPQIKLLSHIEQNLYSEKPAQWKGGLSGLKLVRCANIFTQAKSIAAELLRLMREEKLNPEQAAVLCEDPAQLAAIRRVLESCGIPVFMDQKRSVLHNPAAQLCCSALDMASEGLRASSVITFLKSGLFKNADRASISEFENYVKQYHIKNNAFLKPFKYGKDALGPKRFAAVDGQRRVFAEMTEPFIKAFSEAESVADKSAAFYAFISDAVKLPQLLEERARMLSDAGLTDAAEECVQVFSAVTSLLDQMVELIGSEQISAKDYAACFKDALADIEIGILPQARGRVLLGSVKRSKLPEIRALFIAGINDGVLPSDPAAASLLTERELEELEKKGFRVSKGSELLRSEEDMLIYRAFAAPQEYLWLGCSLSDSEGKDIKPSSLITRVKSIIPKLTEEEDIENSADELAYMQSGRLAAEHIGAALQSSVSGETELSDAEKECFNNLRNAENPQLEAALKGLGYRNSASKLESGSCASLFEKRPGIQSYSPSRLESFATCPFRHFVNYGLRPEERREFEISSLELGDIYHECLQKLSERLSAPAKEGGFAFSDPRSLWMTAGNEDIKNFVDEIINGMSESSLDGIMSGGGRERYSVRRIKDVAFRFCMEMVEQVRKGRIIDMRFETPFGPGAELPPIAVMTKNGKIFVEGKIDRIDRLDVRGSEDADYVKIIDYKSGSKSFSREEAERGLTLQLMVYLEGAMNSDKSLKPAGVFYYNIKDPRETVSLAELGADEISADIAARLSSNYRLDGLAVDEGAVLEAIDTGAPCGTIEVMGLKRKKDGSWDPAHVTTAEDFDEFRRVFMQSLTAVCEELSSGYITVQPRRLGGKGTACDFCSYRSICFYDKAFDK